MNLFHGAGGESQAETLRCLLSCLFLCVLCVTCNTYLNAPEIAVCVGRGAATCSGLAAAKPTELPCPILTPHSWTQQPQSSGVSPNPAALLLVRYHNLIISMILFFPVSGINTIKTELSVFIVPGFVMIVN